MKSKANLWPLAVIGLLLICGAAFSQLQPLTTESIRLHGGMPSPRLGGAPADHVDNGVQPVEAPALSFTFGKIDFPRQLDSGTFGINDKGQIVGGYGTNMAGDGVSDHGFLLQGNKFIAIDYPGAGWTEANAINKYGVIVGQYGATFSDGHGFKLVGTTYTSIDYPGASFTSTNGINKPGDIVGVGVAGGVYHGFLLSKGVFTSIDVPGALGTFPFAINTAGDIIGEYTNTGSDSHGFLYSGGTFTTIDYPGYSQNYVGGINDKGVIVGGYGDPVTVNGVEYLWEHGYIYESGKFTNVDTPFGPPPVTQPFQINNNGVMVGEYVDNASTVYGFGTKVGP